MKQKKFIWRYNIVSCPVLPLLMTRSVFSSYHLSTVFPRACPSYGARGARNFGARAPKAHESELIYVAIAIMILYSKLSITYQFKT